MIREQWLVRRVRKDMALPLISRLWRVTTAKIAALAPVPTLSSPIRQQGRTHSEARGHVYPAEPSRLRKIHLHIFNLMMRAIRVVPALIKAISRPIPFPVRKNVLLSCIGSGIQSLFMYTCNEVDGLCMSEKKGLPRKAGAFWRAAHVI